MDIEKEQLKLKLIEAQMMVLQYQHSEISANLKKVMDAETQKRFDAAVDAREE